MKVLYVGGTGEISLSCVQKAVAAGHDVTVFNRGQRAIELPGVTQLTGDLADLKTYQAAAHQSFDVVCQFLVFTEAAAQQDIDLFAGHCGQYVFISSASAYQKPPPADITTESTPLGNPFWEYSRRKAACETLLQEADNLPLTIVRPSHTYRTRFPSTVIDGDHLVWRLREGKPVPIHDGGKTLWTLTHSDDFARAFTALFGNERALGETFQITDEQAYSWRDIITMVAESIGSEARLRSLSTAQLVEQQPEWRGPLMGDKSNDMVFDNQKVRDVTGGWRCEISLPEGLRRVVTAAAPRLDQGYSPDPSLDTFIDNILINAEPL